MSFGKMCVVLILLSAITWVPGLLLFLVSVIPRRLQLVRRQFVDCQRDLSQQPGVDTMLTLLSQTISALGQVANGGQRGAAGFVFDPLGVQ